MARGNVKTMGIVTPKDERPPGRRRSVRRARDLLAATLAGTVAAASVPTHTSAQVAVPVCDGSLGYSASFDGRRTFLWRPDWLEAIRADQRNATYAPARSALIRRADAAMEHPDYTVVDKTRMPASGDRHDYMSMGPYWWPDPAEPDGLPYVRRDGQINPERDTSAFDLHDLDAMSHDVQALSMAWYLTGETRYAEQAARLIRAWFLTPETRMNPNFEHGQAVPGRVTGRAEGVIDASRLVGVIESLGLLDISAALTALERAALRDWFAELVRWMATSDIGRAERAATNNHGIYFDMLVGEFSLYAGLDGVAAAVAERFKTERIMPQVAPDGSLPQELERTRSLHYTNWTLTAAFDMADIGRCVGVDLWNFQDTDGRSLQSATGFVAQWAGRERQWPYPELDRNETSGLYEVLRRGAWAWSNPELEAKASLYADRHDDLDLNLRLPPYAP